MQQQWREQRPWQWMYSTAVWKRHRRDQLKKQPLCEECLRQGYVEAATVVHHTRAHKGDWRAFCSRDLESLCKECHDLHTANVERSNKNMPRFDADGWPL